MRTVPEVTDLDLVFGCTDHMPEWKDIPEEFKNGNTKWNKLFSLVFYNLLPADSGVTPKEGVDALKVGRVLKSFMNSYAPKHEHKEAAAAYLMSEWFEDYTVGEK